MGVARFLGRGRDGIQPDKGEEDNRRAAHYSAKAIWQKRRPVRRIHHKRAKRDKEDDDRNLHDHNPGVGSGAFPNAEDQEAVTAATIRNAGRLRANDVQKSAAMWDE